MAPKKRTTRASPATTTTTTTPVTNAQLKALIDQGVADALAARDADRSRNGDDSHNSGTGSRRTEQTAHECTYTDFLKCQPLNFKGTKGVADLSQWFERMESVFHISNCVIENQVKFATCTLHSRQLVMTVGHDAAYGMPWKTLMKMMTDKYCPRNEIKKLEIKIWDLKVKGADLTSYTQRFQELALLCGRMFPEESDKIEKYVGGLPDMIHGSVMASKPKTMQDVIEITTELMDKKISTLAKRQAENKRKLDNNNQAQQQPPKKASLENMDAYRDEGMGDIIIGEPFLRKVGIKARRFDGIITLYNSDDEVTYQMVQSHLRIKRHTNEQCNKIPPLLKVSEKDEMNGISHAY
ncbi:putative reverse transcriptase domain-containing protein [Tanacetum coccineum]